MSGKVAGVSRSFHTFRTSRGFTLVELLVSIAVGAVLVTALYATFFSVFNAGDASKDGLGRRIEAGRVLDRFSRDINSAYFKTESRSGRFLGELRGLGPVLSFSAFSYSMARENAPASDLVGVSYFTGEDPDDKDGLVFFKEVWNPYINDRFKVDLIAGVEELEISYFNGSVWSKAWDSTLEGELPKAVKVALKFKDGSMLSATSRTMIR